MNLKEQVSEIVDCLKSSGKKVTVENIIVASLFVSFGSLSGNEDEVKEIIKELKGKDKPTFLCIWGAWEKAIYDYVPDIKKHGLKFFTTQDTYTPLDYYDIKNLSVLSLWKSPTGNHIVIRIK